MSSTTVGRPMEILLVEDNLIDARLTMSALKKGHVPHRLTLIRDGQEALEFLYREDKFARAPRPDLILLDLNLPSKSGLELLALIKGDIELQGILVVILTGSEAEEDRHRCELLHVDSYITKPVKIEGFLDVVRQLKKYWLEDVILPAMD